ncbi:MAG: hypothetical protein QXZ20_04345 [Candidatus Aenigmatarchaeota archaeon]
MVIEVTLDTVLIFLVFVIVVFILYKTFKLIVKASLIVFAAFSFPWVAQYIGLPITPSIETGLMFAAGGLADLVYLLCTNFLILLLNFLEF